jgi:hypothetical protein
MIVEAISSNDVKNVRQAAAVGPDQSLPVARPAVQKFGNRLMNRRFVRGFYSNIDSSKLIGSSPTACSKLWMKFCGLWERALLSLIISFLLVSVLVG